MNLAEWHAVLATEPATPNQVGAIHGEFRRLGLDGPADRPVRLAVSAELLGLDQLHSTAALPMGQAGRLLAMLRQTASRADLDAAVASGRDDCGGHQSASNASDSARINLAQAIALAIAIAIETMARPERTRRSR